MMKPVIRVGGEGASALSGTTVFDVPKALWNGGMLLSALILAAPLFTWGAFLLFLATTYISLLVGHSVGMHRLMIHRSFDCPKPVERFLIYIGVLVGVAGPLGILRVHDIRDWAQRQPECHAFFAHTKPLMHDLWWQLTSRFNFSQPPAFTIEARFADDRFYQFLEANWRFQQVPVAVLFYAIGGWGWVVWGVCLRVFVSAAGHWTITYFCHNPGPGRWKVINAAVQASNLRGMGLLTYGECWHNNHHAFPESARIGLEPGQLDPAWWFISTLKYLGVATNIGEPRPLADRDDLIEMQSRPLNV
jgi:fatty-acid desaturase